MDTRLFYRNYLQTLNPQQRDAVLAVEGPVLILATPGSGKTTVLITRLGYMTHCCGIDPCRILTMTYTRSAARDMRSRFAELFGEELARKIPFRTINGLSARIINYAGRRRGKAPFSLLEEGERSRILRSCWQLVIGDYPEDSDVRELGTAITYIKNMLLTDDEISKLDSSIKKLPELFQQYQSLLKQSRMMDYDDQMCYAHRLLQRDSALLAALQQQYPYICVDEAQDSSLVQHEIIRLLASESRNLFMVGDEDQSIYSFRAASPERLLHFEQEYPEGQLLLIEENYRSTPEIIEIANRFVARNRFRHPKCIVPTRESGDPVRLIPVDSRKEQYTYLLDSVPFQECETAILFRNNDSALPLIDRFEAAGIPYNARNFEDVFFTHRVVVDLLDILRFSQAPSDPEIFQRIYYKFEAGITKQAAQYAISVSRKTGTTLFSAVSEAPDLRNATRDTVAILNRHLQKLTSDRAETALQRIWEAMRYGRYVEHHGLDSGKYFILRMLAEGLPDIAALLKKLDGLRITVAEHQDNPKNRIILSTIHSSKGLEYDQVFLLDMLDGILPTKTKSEAETQEEIQAYEEERRLFYVAMTRAKNHLSVFLCKGKASFPQEVALSIRVPKRPATSVLSPSHRVAETAATFLSRVQVGSEVEHRRFGKGLVLDISGDLIRIDFDEHGERRLSISTCLRSGLLK